MNEINLDHQLKDAIQQQNLTPPSLYVFDFLLGTISFAFVLLTGWFWYTH